MALSVGCLSPGGCAAAHIRHGDRAAPRSASKLSAVLIERYLLDGVAEQAEPMRLLQMLCVSASVDGHATPRRSGEASQPSEPLHVLDSEISARPASPQ